MLSQTKEHPMAFNEHNFEHFSHEKPHRMHPNGGAAGGSNPNHSPYEHPIVFSNSNYEKWSHEPHHKMHQLAQN
jgi:hypothetical protein